MNYLKGKIADWERHGIINGKLTILKGEARETLGRKIREGLEMLIDKSLHDVKGLDNKLTSIVALCVDALVSDSDSVIIVYREGKAYVKNKYGCEELLSNLSSMIENSYKEKYGESLVSIITDVDNMGLERIFEIIFYTDYFELRVEAIDGVYEKWGEIIICKGGMLYGVFKQGAWKSHIKQDVALWISKSNYYPFKKIESLKEKVYIYSVISEEVTEEYKNSIRFKTSLLTGAILEMGEEDDQKLLIEKDDRKIPLYINYSFGKKEYIVYSFNGNISKKQRLILFSNFAKSSNIVIRKEGNGEIAVEMYNDFGRNGFLEESRMTWNDLGYRIIPSEQNKNYVIGTANRVERYCSRDLPKQLKFTPDGVHVKNISYIEALNYLTNGEKIKKALLMSYKESLGVFPNHERKGTM